MSIASLPLLLFRDFSWTELKLPCPKNLFRFSINDRLSFKYLARAEVEPQRIVKKSSCFRKTRKLVSLDYVHHGFSVGVCPSWFFVRIAVLPWKFLAFTLTVLCSNFITWKNQAHHAVRQKKKWKIALNHLNNRIKFF